MFCRLYLIWLTLLLNNHKKDKLVIGRGILVNGKSNIISLKFLHLFGVLIVFGNRVI